MGSIACQVADFSLEQVIADQATACVVRRNRAAHKNRKTPLARLAECNESLHPKSTPAPALESPDATRRPMKTAPLQMLQAGLDLLDQGITVFDGDLRLVAWNGPSSNFSDFLTSWPMSVRRLRASSRYNAERGEYGPGDRGRRLRSGSPLPAISRSRYRTPAAKRRMLLLGEPLPTGASSRSTATSPNSATSMHLSERQGIQLEERVRRRTASSKTPSPTCAPMGKTGAALRPRPQRSPPAPDQRHYPHPDRLRRQRDEVYQFTPTKGYSDWFGHPEGAVTDRACST